MGSQAIDVKQLVRKMSRKGALSQEDAGVLIETLARGPLGVRAEVANQVVVLVRAAQSAESITRRIAGEPKQVIGAERLLRDALLRGEVEQRVFEEAMLEAEAAGQVLGSRAKSNPRQYPNKLRKDGVLLGVPHGNRFLFLAFQFDTKRRRIHPVVQEVNLLLEAKNDPFGVASWWITPSERLGGRPPKDLIGRNDEEQIRALAEAELHPLG